MLKYCLPLLSVILFTQCKTTNVTSLSEYKGRYISFGNGGGFTGKILNFNLLDNGMIFKGNEISENMAPFKKISKEEVNQIFSTYDSMGFGKMDVDGPGNMYFYVEMNEADGKHKLLWGSHDAGESKELRVYHANLMRLIRSKNQNSKEAVK